MPKAGMLVQMDFSQHQWLKDILEKWHLIAMIDDASSEVPYARFFPKDTLNNFGGLFASSKLFPDKLYYSEYPFFKVASESRFLALGEFF